MVPRIVSFPIGMVKLNLRGTLMAAVINVDAYPFLTFSEHTCHLKDERKDIFWLHCFS